MSYFIPGGFFPPDVTTPSAIAAPSIVTRKGSGSGNYTTTSATYVDVDATNLAYTATVSTGSKIIIVVTGRVYSVGGAHGESLAITDGTTVLAELTNLNANNGNGSPFTLSYAFIGDNASHTFKLRFAEPGGGTCGIGNSTPTDTPQMMFFITGVS